MADLAPIDMREAHERFSELISRLGRAKASFCWSACRSAGRLLPAEEKAALDRILTTSRNPGCERFDRDEIYNDRIDALIRRAGKHGRRAVRPGQQHPRPPPAPDAWPSDCKEPFAGLLILGP